MQSENIRHRYLRDDPVGDQGSPHPDISLRLESLTSNMKSRCPSPGPFCPTIAYPTVGHLMYSVKKDVAILGNNTGS